MTESPTRVRWAILAVTTLSSVLLYLDRNCVALALEAIRVDTGATQQQMGWFLSAFFWSYALGQVPAGGLSDRLGIRITLTWYILLWSLFTALLGLSTGITALIACRLGCGLAQAGAYPSCARAVRDWMPLMQRGTASSIVAFGGRLGGALAPVLTAAMMLFLATWNTSPQIRSDELLDARAAVIKIYEFIPGTTDMKARDLQRPPTFGRIPREDQARLQDWIAANPDAISQSDLADMLNRWRPADWLRDINAEQIAELGLDPKTIERVTKNNPATELDHRQAWEALLPGMVKKLESRGWRGTLIVYGASGIFVAALFWLIFRNNPSLHPQANAAEQQLILGMETRETSTASHSSFPWLAILRNVSLWGNCLGQFTTNLGWMFLVTWLPRYLDEVHHVAVLERGFLTSVPILAGMGGMIAGGPWTDRLTNRWGVLWGRRLPIVISRITAALGYGLCILVAFGVAGPLGSRTAIWTVITGLAIVAISTDLGVAATWAFAQDISGRHTAAVLGWGNMWGNLGAALAPPLYSRIIGEQATLGTWNLMFAFCAGAFLVSGVGGWLMDSRQVLEPEIARGKSH